MINNFEDITADLTDWEEKNILPMVRQGFQTRYDNLMKAREQNAWMEPKSQTISAREICEKINAIMAESNVDYKLTDSKLRKFIHVIRRNGSVGGYLIASSTGYWIELDVVRVAEYLEGLKSRETQMRNIRISLMKRMKESEPGEYARIYGEKESCSSTSSGREEQNLGDRNEI